MNIYALKYCVLVSYENMLNIVHNRFNFYNNNKIFHL